jgi:threonine/homoserine/homoserine lactone efflux protein
MEMHRAVALVAFVAVGSGSPGPNNTLLLASGVTFGFRRSVPHVIGTGVGMVVLVAAAATSEEVLVSVLPDVRVGLKVVATAYLVSLAARLPGGVALDPASVRTPFGVGRGMLFQFVNPKAWIFALALVSAYVPSNAGRAEVAVVMAAVGIVVVATATVWALGGTTLRRALATDRARRTAGVVLGALLLASVAFLWI